MATKRAGRRRGESNTREQILASARKLFAADGLEKTSVRAIAADADVDSALIHHYFGSKQKLFYAAIQLPADPEFVRSAVREADLDEVGITLISALLELWDSQTQALVAAARAILSSDPTLIRAFLMEVALAELLPRIENEKGGAALRGNLIAATLIGVIMSRYIVQLDPLSTMDREHVAALIAPRIQEAVNGDLPLQAQEVTAQPTA